MSFPHDDRPWAETAAFLRARLMPAHRLVAPDPFRFAIPRALRFAQLRAETPQAFDWVVVHKAELARIPPAFLHALTAETVPVFANEVFVVFASSPPGDLVDLGESDHVRAFHAGLETIPLPPGAVPPQPRDRPGLAASPARPAREAAPVAARPWLVPGAIPGTARERAYQDELDRLVVDYLGTADGLAVLDIGCGGGRLAALLTGAASVVGVDLAEDALARARARHAELPGFAFARMDAARLGFAEASFDAVVMLDMLDGTPDAAAALAEAARVLARGGRLVVTATNRDSLPLRAMRRLGQPAPVGGVSVQELTGMLRAAGLTPMRLDGVFLSFGWAMPGTASAFGPLEEDPEFIEAARALGRRCGPDHALAIAALAWKS
jgi:SAM-dependent methyltransferase